MDICIDMGIDIGMDICMDIGIDIGICIGRDIDMDICIDISNKITSNESTFLLIKICNLFLKLRWKNLNSAIPGCVHMMFTQYLY